jgi:putative ABC transport system permease protein
MRATAGITRNLAEFGHDLQMALRSMWRKPVLPAVIVLTIGLGLGAATAIFTATELALIRPLPFATPAELVYVGEVRDGSGERSSTSYATLLDWRTRTGSFAALEGYNGSNPAVGTGDRAQKLRGAQVTAGFFRLLGVPMSQGRDFVQSDDPAANAGVVVVSDRFARSSGAGAGLAETISISGRPYVIVGVLPRTFHFARMQDADVFVPFVGDEYGRVDRSERAIEVVGRLRGSTDLPRARAELAAVMSELASEHPGTMAGRTAFVIPLRDALLGNVKPIVIGLLVAVAMLLAAMATNLALLMLARNVKRAPELVTRSALGATRGRLLRQLLAESILFAAVGGVLALMIADGATQGLIHAIPEGVRINMPYLAGAGLDGWTIGFIAGVSALLAVALGVGPAVIVTTWRGRAADSRSTVGPGHRRFRQGLVAAQLALTVVLLISAGLLVGSFRNLVARDVGLVEPESLLTATVGLYGARYDRFVAQRQFFNELIPAALALPGVRAASAINELPGQTSTVTTIERVDRPQLPSAQTQAALRIVVGDYFSTVGVPLLSGRTFYSSDRSDTRRVAVVSAELARTFFANDQAIGQKIRLARTGEREWEVVGIIGDVHVADLDAESLPAVYLSHDQLAENQMSLLLRTRLDPSALAGELRRIVRRLDPGIPVYSVTTLPQKLYGSRAVSSRQFPMILIGAFGLAALILALLALYALVAHDVLVRRREFAIRIALGARPRMLRQLVLRHSLMLGLIGVGAGALLSLGVSKIMRALLFGITTADWRVYGAVAIGVLASALSATLLPAFRAAATKPSMVMREE